MAIFLILFGMALLAGLLYLFTPKATTLHEVLHLPEYWLQLHRVDTSRLRPERIPYGKHARQYFMYVPPPSGALQPEKLVVYFHGGGWKFGRPENFTSFALPFHEEGLPVVLPSLRRTPGHNYFDIRKDLNQVLQQVNELQKSKGWEGQKIVLGGMSAGGNLAALLYYDWNALRELQVDPGIFSGLFVCGAPLDLTQMRNTIALWAFAGRRNSRQFELANPVSHLSGSVPQPVLCIHGEKDGMVEFASARSFHDHISRVAPETIHFITLPSGTHLDSASWSHSAPHLKREILSWLRKL
ncbi:MAG: alpha/beta hydrolase [Saprospiraceae bacterium]|nr:alpha/beta hydrolase [Lewinella sp.]